MEIEDVMNKWKDAGFTDEQIDKFVNEYYNLVSPPEPEVPEEPEIPTVPEEPTKPEVPPTPEEPEIPPTPEVPPTEDKDDTPSTDESDPPMPSEPKPENPEDREYDPEKNVDEEGGGAGTDPPCKQIFNPTVARMKRGETYDKVIPGGRDGYTCKINTGHARRRLIQIMDEPAGSVKMKKFEGRCDITISPVKPTALYMPTEEVYISGYNTSDGTGVEFYADELNNVYVKAFPGSPVRSITLEYTVWCKWSDKIDNLEYYYREYDDNMNLQMAYEHGKDINYRFNEALATMFRRNVPKILKTIDEDYFDDMIKAIRKMSSPGFVADEKSIVGKKLRETRQKYNFKKTIELLAGYMLSFGCGVIPEGDMVIACIESGEGACRHRALAFFLISAVLGIPVRYCCSDCHAYPEVYFGNVKRWVGIDLGGCPPPQPDGPQNVPKDIMEVFANKLRLMGWDENEDRFKKAMNAAKAFQERTGG